MPFSLQKYSISNIDWFLIAGSIGAWWTTHSLSPLFVLAIALARIGYKCILDVPCGHYVMITRLRGATIVKRGPCRTWIAPYSAVCVIENPPWTISDPLFVPTSPIASTYIHGTSASEALSITMRWRVTDPKLLAVFPNSLTQFIHDYALRATSDALEDPAELAAAGIEMVGIDTCRRYNDNDVVHCRVCASRAWEDSAAQEIAQRALLTSKRLHLGDYTTAALLKVFATGKESPASMLTVNPRRVDVASEKKIE